MDFREPPRTPAAPRSGRTPATFAYSLPVADGWLVEETVLAARPAVEPVALVPLLAARAPPGTGRHARPRPAYGVRPDPDGRNRVLDEIRQLSHSAQAAGYVNPTSRLLRRPLDADGASGRRWRSPSHSAPALRLTWLTPPWCGTSCGRLRIAGHDCCTTTALTCWASSTEPPSESSSQRFSTCRCRPGRTYMRADSSPTDVGRVMAQLFRAAPWSTRRRLLRGPSCGLRPPCPPLLIRPGPPEATHRRGRGVDPGGQGLGARVRRRAADSQHPARRNTGRGKMNHWNAYDRWLPSPSTGVSSNVGSAGPAAGSDETNST